MKKRNLKSLILNKCKISELRTNMGGRNNESNDCPTASACSCVSCKANCETTIQPPTGDCER